MANGYNYSTLWNMLTFFNDASDSITPVLYKSIVRGLEKFAWHFLNYGKAVVSRLWSSYLNSPFLLGKISTLHLTNTRELPSSAQCLR